MNTLTFDLAGIALIRLGEVADVVAEQVSLYDENNLYDEVDDLESELNNDFAGYTDDEDFPD